MARLAGFRRGLEVHQQICRVFVHALIVYRSSKLTDDLACVKTYQPLAWARSKTTLQKICAEHPRLEAGRLKNTSFASSTVNIGRSCTFLHRDSLNKPFHFCAVLALGHFPHESVGQIILWELGVVVDFPPGTVALLPSADITHGNTALGESDGRTSITWYTAGSLFQYSDAGMGTQGELDLHPEKKEEYQRRVRDRTDEALRLFVKVDDLFANHHAE